MGNHNFFVLEDNVFQRDIIKSILKKLNPNIIVDFGNGKEAYDYLRKSKIVFDLFILDLNVPGYDGLKFIEEASHVAVLKNVLIISAMDDDILKSVESYSSSKKNIKIFVHQKPIIPEIFINAINEIIKIPKKYLNLKNELKLKFKEFSKNEILDGIIKEEFFPIYQPQINLQENKIVGLEALARWEHKIYGVVPPNRFVPVLELADNNIKIEFTFLLLKNIVKDVLELKRLGYNDFKIAINVFLSILELEDFCDKFVSVIKEYNVEQNIVIEVTESGISDSKTSLNYSLSRLRIKGIDISLDDFGTGYASLLQLASFPFSEIKIDRSFIKNINSDNKNLKIVEMSKLLADKLGVRLIAEGCETQEEVEKLKEIGISVVQGYYFSKPINFEETLLFLSSF